MLKSNQYIVRRIHLEPSAALRLNYSFQPLSAMMDGLPVWGGCGPTAALSHLQSPPLSAASTSVGRTTPK